MLLGCQLPPPAVATPPELSASDLLQRARSCLLHLLYGRKHRACEALGLSLTGLTAAAANGIEVGLPSFTPRALAAASRETGSITMASSSVMTCWQLSL
jgi:hypothetical protein